MKASTIVYGLSHPRQAALILAYGKLAVVCDRLGTLSGKGGKTAREIYGSLTSLSLLGEHIRNALGETGGGYRAEVRFGDARALYALCMLVKPKAVIETGVATGVSSAFILKALDENSQGMLYSIDLPRYDTDSPKAGVDCSLGSEPKGGIIPKGMQPGFVVPDGLRDRWEVELGSSGELLGDLLKKVAGLDLFFHDSAHTYENMSFEYETVWPSIRTGGVLISHDVDWNTAFSDFAVRNRRRPIYIPGTGLGGVRK